MSSILLDVDFLMHRQLGQMRVRLDALMRAPSTTWAKRLSGPDRAEVCSTLRDYDKVLSHIEAHFRSYLAKSPPPSELKKGETK